MVLSCYISMVPHWKLLISKSIFAINLPRPSCVASLSLFPELYLSENPPNEERAEQNSLIISMHTYK